MISLSFLYLGVDIFRLFSAESSKVILNYLSTNGIMSSLTPVASDIHTVCLFKLTRKKIEMNLQ